MFTWTINLHSVVTVPIPTVSLSLSINFETLGIAVVCGTLSVFVTIPVSYFSFTIAFKKTISVPRLPFSVSVSISVAAEIRIVERAPTRRNARDRGRRARRTNATRPNSRWLCRIGGESLPNSEQFSTEATNFFFIMAPDFSMLKFEFVQRLTDYIEFIDL